MKCDKCKNGYGETREGDNIDDFHCGCLLGLKTQYEDWAAIWREHEGSAQLNYRLALKVKFYKLAYETALEKANG